jgi:hypothetical protein
LYLLNRLEVGKDGKTAWERIRGKSASALGVEFGEKVAFKKKLKDKRSKVEASWERAFLSEPVLAVESFGCLRLLAFGSAVRSAA